MKKVFTFVMMSLIVSQLHAADRQPICSEDVLIQLFSYLAEDEIQTAFADEDSTTNLDTLDPNEIMLLIEMMNNRANSNFMRLHSRMKRESLSLASLL